MPATSYNRFPEISVLDAGEVMKLDKLIALIKEKQYQKIVIETYPGIDLEIVKNNFLNHLSDQYQLLWSEDFACSAKEYHQKIKDELTDDRVFGKITTHQYKDFFPKKPINVKPYTICYGVGANYLIDKPDLIIYLDLPRWEIQLRYRAKKPVFFKQTLESETIQNFKRGYFIEWRMADEIKKSLLPKIDFYLDGSTKQLKVITKEQFFTVLEKASQRPFRLVPYFDFGVWGGTWMSQKFDLPTPKKGQWAWGFDGVPEENSLRFRLANEIIEMPAINLVFFESQNLLGKEVEKRFGKEFPIRFDFLDTINGQNLSLQVHPTNQYIKKQFNMPYTQEESYYILDADPKANPVCYLGLKDQIKKEDFIADLEKAQKTNELDVEKYVNVYPAKKHDHFLHPAGVIHSSGKGCMVLEISATPYIFTFKLWDWKRVDLDGKPRPINIKHGQEVINYTFDTQKTTKELVNNFQVINETKDYYEEKTGLHPDQFIETRRFLIKNNNGVIIDNHQSVNMLNLVSGKQIIVESIDNLFPPLIINYAETFIVPAACKKYRIRPLSSDQEPIMVIQSFIRNKK